MENTMPKFTGNKKCGMRCEIFSRVTGFLRPISHFNHGKKEEFKDRKMYNVTPGKMSVPKKERETMEASNR